VLIEGLAAVVDEVMLTDHDALARTSSLGLTTHINVDVTHRQNIPLILPPATLAEYGPSKFC